MKTIKIIDLFNKIANGEELPKKIKYKNDIYEYEHYDYFGINRGYLFDRYNVSGILNDEVEIIEENKIPEKISINDNGTIGFPNGEWTARNMDKAFAMKINSIIDYLESKGE